MKMTPRKLHKLLSILLISSISGWPFSNGQDLISATCNQTLHFDVCMSSLNSDPRSHTADLEGLMAISLNLTIAQGEQMMGNLTALKDNVKDDDDSFMAACLDDCLVEYSDAVENLRQSFDALSKREYDDVNDLVSAAMTDSDTCEDGFQESGHFSPLKKIYGCFSQLCSICLAITKLL